MVDPQADWTNNKRIKFKIMHQHEMAATMAPIIARK